MRTYGDATRRRILLAWSVLACGLITAAAVVGLVHSWGQSRIEVSPLSHYGLLFGFGISQLGATLLVLRERRRETEVWW